METDLLATITLPVCYILATFRTLLVLLIVFAYLLASSICLICVSLDSSFAANDHIHSEQYPIPPLYRAAEHILIYILGRAVLLVVGAIWISPAQFSRKRLYVLLPVLDFPTLHAFVGGGSKWWRNGPLKQEISLFQIGPHGSRSCGLQYSLYIFRFQIIH